MATVRKQAGRALLVAWGMRAFWARQKVYVLTHLHRQITLLEARKTAPPPEFTACRQITTVCRTWSCSVICQAKLV